MFNFFKKNIVWPEPTHKIVKEEKSFPVYEFIFEVKVNNEILKTRHVTKKQIDRSEKYLIDGYIFRKLVMIDHICATSIYQRIIKNEWAFSPSDEKTVYINNCKYHEYQPHLERQVVQEPMVELELVNGEKIHVNKKHISYVKPIEERFLYNTRLVQYSLIPIKESK